MQVINEHTFRFTMFSWPMFVSLCQAEEHKELWRSLTQWFNSVECQLCQMNSSSEDKRQAPTPMISRLMVSFIITRLQKIIISGSAVWYRGPHSSVSLCTTSINYYTYQVPPSAVPLSCHFDQRQPKIPMEDSRQPTVFCLCQLLHGQNIYSSPANYTRVRCSITFSLPLSSFYTSNSPTVQSSLSRWSCKSSPFFLRQILWSWSRSNITPQTVPTATAIYNQHRQSVSVFWHLSRSI